MQHGPNSQKTFFRILREMVEVRVAELLAIWVLGEDPHLCFFLCNFIHNRKPHIFFKCSVDFNFFDFLFGLNEKARKLFHRSEPNQFPHRPMIVDQEASNWVHWYQGLIQAPLHHTIPIPLAIQNKTTLPITSQFTVQVYNTRNLLLPFLLTSVSLRTSISECNPWLGRKLNKLNNICRRFLVVFPFFTFSIYLHYFSSNL